MSSPYVNIMVGTTTAGILGGLGYSVYNKTYGTSVYGSNYSDPYVGYADFAIHGAALGTAAGLASVGLRYQANQKKLEHLSDATKQMYKMFGGY